MVNHFCFPYDQVTSLDVQRLRNEKKAITMVTAYTYPSAVHVDAAGIDILLVGPFAQFTRTREDLM